VSPLRAGFRPVHSGSGESKIRRLCGPAEQPLASLLAFSYRRERAGGLHIACAGQRKSPLSADNVSYRPSSTTERSRQLGHRHPASSTVIIRHLGPGLLLGWPATRRPPGPEAVLRADPVTVASEGDSGAGCGLALYWSIPRPTRSFAPERQRELARSLEAAHRPDLVHAGLTSRRLGISAANLCQHSGCAAGGHIQSV